MKSLVIRNGLIAGGILVLMMLVSMLLMSNQQMDFKTGEVVGYVTMLLSLSMIFFGVRSYREQEGGTISFGTAFKMGLLIALIASALYVIGWMILSNFLAPDFGDQYYEYFIEQLRESGKPQAEIDATIASYEQSKEMYKNPFFKMGITFLEIFPVGLLVAVVSALLLKRKPNEG